MKVFAGMRGAAMKVGQTLSAVDLGLVPEEIRPEFQMILAELQQDAEPVPAKAIRGVIEEDLGEPVSRLFADFDDDPVAAASIGQVHRATTTDGRDVAVKVQYPGIAEAIHADLQNLRLALKLLSAIAPGSTPPRSPARSASASATSSTTSSRPPTSARWRASTAAIRSSWCPTP